MPDAVRALLATGLVTLNSREHACRLSGFMPIHAVIANSLPDMYDLLTRELPPELRAVEESRTRKGKRLDLQLYNLSCLQLAAQLGDHRMLRHMLKKQWCAQPASTQLHRCLAGVVAAHVWSRAALCTAASCGCGVR
jgi:hypothetical protein